MDWLTCNLDEKFFVDSGLLFQVNREIFHPIGLALTIKKDEAGKLSFGLKDSRQNPEALKFETEPYIKCKQKFDNFMQEFGHNQMDKRSKSLGWACQYWS